MEKYGHRKARQRRERGDAKRGKHKRKRGNESE